MRLINTTTLELEDILSPDVHPYAILSHTWEEDEVTFQDWNNAGLEMCRKKKGFAKIEATCRMAKQRGLRYAWVDTCCINKESSAELTEAINSMFAWYKKSTVCFAYLSDLPAHRPEFPDPLLPGCRWFTRGWTLQELIAPKMLIFYDREWNDRGSKRLRSYELSSITGIDLAVLENNSFLKSMPVGRKMSWAAARKTSREEDMAYCLFGIFDVNMSLIYGEGQGAFMRLQEEILKKRDDMTLFAWTSNKSQSVSGLRRSPEQEFRGILARSPEEFLVCRNVVREHHIVLNRRIISSNSALLIHPYLGGGLAGDYILIVGLSSTGPSLRSEKIGIYLQKTPTGFYRKFPGKLFFGQDLLEREAGASAAVFYKDVPPVESYRISSRVWSTDVAFDLPEHLEVSAVKVRPHNIWNAHRRAFLSETGLRYTAVSHIHLADILTGKTARLAIVCEIVAHLYEIREPLVAWAITCTEADARGCPRRRKVLGLVDEYMGAANETAAPPAELTALCAQMAEQVPTPRRAHLHTHRGVRVGVALQTWPGELRVVFPTAPWYLRGRGGQVERTSKGSIVAAARQLTRRWTRSSLGSDESQVSGLSKCD